MRMHSHPVRLVKKKKKKKGKKKKKKKETLLPDSLLFKNE